MMGPAVEFAMAVTFIINIIIVVIFVSQTAAPYPESAE
jgi:hypothetical protein